jgi:hypothetical protein
MALVIALLTREQSGINHKPASEHLLHPDKLACTFCGQQYWLEYDPRFISVGEEVTRNLLFKIQDKVNLLHRSEHLEISVSVPITV